MAFNLKDYIAKNSTAAKPVENNTLDEVDAFLGEASPSAPAPSEPSGPQRDYEAQPIRAVFQDVKDRSGKPATFTSDELSQLGDEAKAGKIHVADTAGPQPISTRTSGTVLSPVDDPNREKASFYGGVEQGLTLGFSDELRGLAASAGGMDYSTVRDARRADLKDAKKWNPGKYLAGELAASVPLGFVPGLAPARGASLLSRANIARGAAVGGISASGGSDADLIKGEVGKLAVDTGLGALVGGGVTAGLGAIGKGIDRAKKLAGEAPARVEKRTDADIMDALTLGAKANQRDAVVGELGADRDKLLKLVKNTPEILTPLKARNMAGTAEAVRAQKAAAEEALTAAEAAASKRGAIRGYDARKVVKALEKHRDTLSENPAPEVQAKAAKVQDLIDNLNAKVIPAPKEKPPEGAELLGLLTQGGPKGVKQQVAMKTDPSLRVAKQFNLATVARDPEALQVKLDAASSTMDVARNAVYDQVDGKPMLLADWLRNVGDIGRAARELGDEQAANAVDGFISSIWRTVGDGGKTLSIDSRKARQIITRVQGQSGYTANLLDPSASAAIRRDIASALREGLHKHITSAGGAAARRKLEKINETISVLANFKKANESRLVAMRANPKPPVPEVEQVEKTGRVDLTYLRNAAEATKDPETKAVLMGAVAADVPKSKAAEIGALAERRDILQKLDDAVSQVATREATPPTRLRVLMDRAKNSVKNSVVAGALGASGAGIASGNRTLAKVGAGIAGAIVAKDLLGPQADKVLARMVIAARRGADIETLQKIARVAGWSANQAQRGAAIAAPQLAAGYALGATGGGSSK